MRLLSSFLALFLVLTFSSNIVLAADTVTLLQPIGPLKDAFVQHKQVVSRAEFGELLASALDLAAGVQYGPGDARDERQRLTVHDASVVLETWLGIVEARKWKPKKQPELPELEQVRSYLAGAQNNDLSGDAQTYELLSQADAGQMPVDIPLQAKRSLLEQLKNFFKPKQVARTVDNPQFELYETLVAKSKFNKVKAKEMRTLLNNAKYFFGIAQVYGILRKAALQDPQWKSVQAEYGEASTQEIKKIDFLVKVLVAQKEKSGSAFAAIMLVSLLRGAKADQQMAVRELLENAGPELRFDVEANSFLSNIFLSVSRPLFKIGKVAGLIFLTTALTTALLDVTEFVPDAVINGFRVANLLSLTFTGLGLGGGGWTYLFARQVHHLDQLKNFTLKCMAKRNFFKRRLTRLNRRTNTILETPMNPNLFCEDVAGFL